MQNLYNLYITSELGPYIFLQNFQCNIIFFQTPFPVCSFVLWLLLLLSHFSRVRLLATPWTAAYQAPPSMGFSRLEYWSGLPLPSLVHWLDCTKFSCLHNEIPIHMQHYHRQKSKLALKILTTLDRHSAKSLGTVNKMNFKQ